LSPPVSGCPGADGGGGFHLLGTDLLGRDVAVRLLYGLGISMAVALSAAAVSFLLGTLLGLACGLAGGWSDRLLLRLLEVLQSIPFLFVVILVSMFSRDVMRVRWADPGAQAMAQAVLLFCCLGAIQWFSLARYARGLAFSLKTAPFVEALVGLGIPRRRIVLRHVLPNTLKPLAAYAVLLVPTLVLEEAFLSFLGFGIQPPYPSLGILLSESVAFMDVRPTLVLIPATTLLVLTWSLNVVAEMLSGRSAVPAALAREDS
jgi:oligopeptide transport system permease protein